MRSLTGQRFHSLTVIGFSHRRYSPNGTAKYIWNCSCDCGKIVGVDGYKLRHGHTKSCGCQKIVTLKNRNTTHAMAGSKPHPMYTCWLNIKNRCNNPNNISYPWYGGKGIKVCDRWEVFGNFRDDMMSGWKEGLEIDRIDGTRDYEPGNCRWVNHHEQLRNYSRNHWLELDGVKKTICDWSAHLGGGHSMVRDRLEYGWDLRRALTTLADKKRQHQKQSRKTV